MIEKIVYLNKRPKEKKKYESMLSWCFLRIIKRGKVERKEEKINFLPHGLHESLFCSA